MAVPCNSHPELLCFVSAVFEPRAVGSRLPLRALRLFLAQHRMRVYNLFCVNRRRLRVVSAPGFRALFDALAARAASLARLGELFYGLGFHFLC